jgi:hypothetical protein
MPYIVLRETASTMFGTDLDAAADRLQVVAGNLIELGWQPAGGIEVATTPISKEVVLLQALWSEKPA